MSPELQRRQMPVCIRRTTLRPEASFFLLQNTSHAPLMLPNGQEGRLVIFSLWFVTTAKSLSRIEENADIALLGR